MALTKDDTLKIRDIVREEIREQGIKLENIDDQLRTLAESISQNLNVKNRVDTNEERLDRVEQVQEMLKSTVAMHSQQLKGA